MSAKRKPIRFVDTWADGDLAPGVEERMMLGVQVSRGDGTGKVRVGWTCPFCRAFVSTFKWALAGSGKRCQCKALAGSTGSVYQWRTEL